MSSYQRKIETKPAKVTPLPIEMDNLTQWFEKQAEEHGLVYLLAHADDGVIWGRVENGKLKLAGSSFAEVNVALRAVTLQQARLFSGVGELLIWRGEANEWHGRFVMDVPASSEGKDYYEECIEETHWLWGTASVPPGPQDGFTLMREGQQGLLHAPPIELKRDERVGLWVRHYLVYDDQGQAYIALSRLVKLEKVA